MSTNDVTAVPGTGDPVVVGGGAGDVTTGGVASTPATGSGATDGVQTLSSEWLMGMANFSATASGVDTSSWMNVTPTAGGGTGTGGGAAAVGSQINALMGTISGLQNGSVTAAQAQAALASATNTLGTSNARPAYSARTT